MDVHATGDILNNTKRPLSERFRALFMLKNAGNDDAVREIARCFVDVSDLLNHELAYCLGQMRNQTAIPKLTEILENCKLAPILRHEAAEALGAIGSKESLPVLKKYTTDSVQEVAETCELAVAQIQWLHNDQLQQEEGTLHSNPFSSVDPAPAGSAQVTNTETLRRVLVDETQPLFERYRAMFSLRNLNSAAAALCLAEGLKCGDSALFRHEVAYVLGQMQNDAVVPRLSECLSNREENCMVRHECAEALGSIASDDCVDILRQFLNDKDEVVRESCEVALDMYKHETSGDLNYEVNIETWTLQISTSVVW